MSLILFGFKASGKTYLGRKLSLKLATPFLDTDDEILSLFTKKHATTLTIPEIYKRLGEESFRDLEEEVIQNITREPFQIIALGGGSLLRASNLSSLEKTGTLVYLKVSFATIKERIFNKNLPAFLEKKDPLKSLQNLYKARSELFEKIPAKKIELDLLEEKETLTILADIALCTQEGYGI